MEHGSHAGHETAAPEPGAIYNVNLQSDPPSPASGQQCHLALVVTEQARGEPLREFEPLHDRLLHLVMVHESLRHFAHVHPVLEDGVFHIDHIFPEAGSFKLWAEARPRGGEPVLAAFRLQVGAGRDQAEASEPEAPYAISLETAPLIVHSDVLLRFAVLAENQPVRDLEPLMAAGGHCVIVSADLQDFLHVHPAEDVAATWRGGPEVSFHTAFHRPGRYRAWGQFQHAGTVLTRGFDLDVAEAHHHSSSLSQ